MQSEDVYVRCGDNNKWMKKRATVASVAACLYVSVWVGSRWGCALSINFLRICCAMVAARGSSRVVRGGVQRLALRHLAEDVADVAGPVPQWPSSREVG